MWTLPLKALIRTDSGKQGGGKTEADVTMKACHNGPQDEAIIVVVVQRQMRMITDDAATEVHLSLSLLHRAADHAYCPRLFRC